MEKKIEAKELEKLQALTGEFNKYKTQLGDITLQKHMICLEVDKLKGEFTVLEKELAEKYGKDSVINLETGEVKPKEAEVVPEEESVEKK